MNKYLIIAHAGLNRTITEIECVEALNLDQNQHYEFVEITPSYEHLKDSYDLPFENLAIEQEQQYKKEILPVLKKNPNFTIAYFGLAPIPLTIHLGFLVGQLHQLEVFQFHHNDKKWYGGKSGNSSNLELNSFTPATDTQKGTGEITIRMFSSYEIEEHMCYEVVTSPLKEYVINTTHTDVDIFKTHEDLEVFASRFYQIITETVNKFPKHDSIHLFAALPCGICFLLGTKINPNIVSNITTYQYGKDKTPKYKCAIILNDEANEKLNLSDEEKEKVDELRQNWADELKQKIKPFINSVIRQESPWFSELIQNSERFKNTGFELLPGLQGTSLSTDEISIDITSTPDGFDYLNNKWILDDSFLHGVISRKNAVDFDIIIAGRLFLFHEALHYSPHGHHLIKEIAQGIGQFPKVIEDADYQADVYAILSEYMLSKTFYSDDTEDVQAFFINAINAAVQTMWSFVGGKGKVDRFQIRSLNRLLIWYWQLILIEKTDNIEDIVDVLLKKPIIEIAGPEIRLVRHRTYFELNDYVHLKCQLAIFTNNKVYRFQPNNIGSIIAGFREKDGEKILSGLRSAFVMIH